MTLDEIVREMQRKPDAQILLEWLAERAEAGDEVDVATDAYFRALEG